MKFKKFMSLILTLVMVLTMLPVGTFSITSVAEDIDDNKISYCPLEVAVKTDKSKYSSIGTAKYIVTIKNNGENAVEKISAVSEFNDLQPISGDLYIKNKKLNPGESLSYSYSATIKPNKLNVFWMIILVIKNMFSGTKSIPSVDFDDGRSVFSSEVRTSYGGVVVTDEVKVYYNYLTALIETDNESDYLKEVSKLAAKTLSDESFNMKDALNNDYYSGRIVVKSDNVQNLNLKSYNPDKIVMKDNRAVLQFNNDAIAKECANDLCSKSSVDYAEPDVIMKSQEIESMTTTTQTSNSSDYSWGEKYIFADEYSHYLETNQYFNMSTVAVVDTGIDLDHPYLKGRILSSGYNLVGFNSIPEDDNGHGTHVSGTIVDCTNNLNVKIMPIKVLDAQGYGFSEITALGIEYAVNNGADIINLSLGGPKSALVDDAVNNAVNEGVVVCVAAGNGDESGKPVDTSLTSPANNTNAIVVGAIDDNGKIASFSNYGTSVDVVAPGVKVMSSFKNGEYAMLSGTSMATPHISAVAAMFKLSNPSFSPKQIEEYIIKYCTDLGDKGRDNIYGYGIVNMYNAIPECIVNFDSNGGSSVSAQKIKSSHEFTLPKPTKSYTIRLNANGGNVAISSYTRNCTFDGWYKYPSFEGVRYAGGTQYTAKADETLYAKWGNPIVGSLNAPSRNNYKFEGWYTSANGGTHIYSSTQLTGDITLYAHWSLNTKTIPNVIGMNYQNAKAVLEGLGMNVQLSAEQNGNYTPGTVFWQSISEGQSVAVGSTITIAYSVGVTHYVYYHCYGQNYSGKWVWGTRDTAPNATEDNIHRIDLTYQLNRSDGYQNGSVAWLGAYACPQCNRANMWVLDYTYVG